MNDGRSRSSRTVLHNADVLDPLPHNLQGIQDACEHNDRRPVLVVVEHRNFQLPLQRLFDFKAFGAADILQIDPAEGGRNGLHRRNNLLLGGGIETDRERVHTAEFLEEHALAFHHRKSRLGSDVAKPQHRGSVGDHRNGASLHGIRVHVIRIRLDPPAGLRNPRCIGR